MQNHSLIERIKNNDGEKVLKEIYEQYRNEFLKWAIKSHDLTMDEAKEVFQQAIIILYENIVFGKVTEINVQMKTYIFGIGKNKIFELVKKRSKNAGDPDEEMLLTYSGVDDEIEDEEKMQNLEMSLQQLGEPCKTILLQYYYHRRSVQEIADKLEYKNSETMKNVKYKCLMRLKKIFFGNTQSLTIERP